MFLWKKSHLCRCCKICLFELMFWKIVWQLQKILTFLDKYFIYNSHWFYILYKTAHLCGMVLSSEIKALVLPSNGPFLVISMTECYIVSYTGTFWTWAHKTTTIQSTYWASHYYILLYNVITYNTTYNVV